MIWAHKGEYPPHAAIQIPHQYETIYVLEFEGKTKIGVSTKPLQRLASLAWEHWKIERKKPNRAAITRPPCNARELEKEILRTKRDPESPGEYTTAPFDEVCNAIEAEFRKQENQVEGSELSVWKELKRGAPKLYWLASTKMWQVTWIAPGREKGGRRRRRRKYFVNEQEAKDYRDQVEQLQKAGALEAQRDAISAMEIMEGTGVTLSQLAKAYMRNHR